MTTLSKYIFWCGSGALLALAGCKKYLQVPLPVNSIAAQSAFGTDAASASSLNGIYGGLLSDGVFDGNGSVGYLTGVYGDELASYYIVPSYQALYTDQVSSTTGGVTATWSTLYQQLYAINQAIQYIPQSSGLQYRNQWMGEAYFMRALCYFYLTNLYGDVPLVVTTDYLANNALARAP
ncbi:MAG TPA: RagB/SusD family nutrient uptake outer membrane protein, partial [Dinghuibacter sp.]|uniref:RagB/SusD family nutrient uptake outer membrane protein n=1 Tax=Dinghuibacter sp. TaxID=2024697 RepID=UPI002BAA67F8